MDLTCEGRQDLNEEMNDQELCLGRCKWMNASKGFGFIVDLATGKDVFVHYTSLKRATRGFRCLYPNEYVQFVYENSPSGPITRAVSGVKGGPLMCEYYHTQPSST
jgi:CspA family cold shock protein